jgi:hypothetical protein
MVVPRPTSHECSPLCLSSVEKAEHLCLVLYFFVRWIIICSGLILGEDLVRGSDGLHAIGNTRASAT